MQDISKEIIIQASGGDIKAFENIYSATSSFVYNVALRMSHNKEDAEEITQDVFLKIHRSLKEFQFKASFKSWVYKIAVTTAINIVKKRDRKSHQTVPYHDAIETIKATDETEKKIEKESNEEFLNFLLAAINPDQRACVILRNIEALSYKEIASALNININTVRTRLARARKIFALYYKKRGGR